MEMLTRDHVKAYKDKIKGCLLYTSHQGEDGKEPQALIAEASEATALNSGDVGRGKTFRHC